MWGIDGAALLMPTGSGTNRVFDILAHGMAFFITRTHPVEANLVAMASNAMDGFFNIGGGKSTSLADLAHMMIRLSGRHVEPRYENSRPGDAKISMPTSPRQQDR